MKPGSTKNEYFYVLSEQRAINLPMKEAEIGFLVESIPPKPYTKRFKVKTFGGRPTKMRGFPVFGGPLR